MADIHVVAGTATAGASVSAPHVHVTVSDGIVLSDSATVTLTRSDVEVSMAALRWFLTPEGRAVAAWLGVTGTWLGVALSFLD